MTEGPQGEGGRLPILLIVAPTAGRLRILPPKSFQSGREWIEKGQAVATIEHGPAEEPDEVLAPARGLLGGLMGRDGEPMREGQPVAWMEGVIETQAVVKPVKDTA